jgi:basic membrane lipoprotein Med (substrate-binding protein (PBP1-ABC) superfamily)
MSNEFGILELNILHTAMNDMIENAIKDRERYGEDTLGTVEKYTELRDKIHTMLEAKCDEADKAIRQLKADLLKQESEKVKGDFCIDGEAEFFASILD